jgi:hypothetical protein
VRLSGNSSAYYRLLVALQRKSIRNFGGNFRCYKNGVYFLFTLLCDGLEFMGDYEKKESTTGKK